MVTSGSGLGGKWSRWSPHCCSDAAGRLDGDARDWVGGRMVLASAATGCVRRKHAKVVETGGRVIVQGGDDYVVR